MTTTTSKSRDYVLAVLIGLALIAVSLFLGNLLGWFTWETINWLEVAAVFINYGCTYLSIKQRRAFYLGGIAASALYAIVFFNAALLASAVLSAYLTITLLYGFFRWGKDDLTRPVRWLQPRWIPVYLGATAILYFGAVAVSGALGGAFAPMDAAILVLTILAQILMDQKLLSSWIVWTAVNVVGIITYFSIGLHFAAVQQVVFFFANIFGFVAWYKSMKTPPPVTTLRANPAGQFAGQDRIWDSETETWQPLRKATTS